jgi:hypothetical protein
MVNPLLTESDSNPDILWPRISKTNRGFPHLFLLTYFFMVNFSTKMTSAVSMVALVASTLSASVVSAASEFLPYAQVLADNDVISAQSTEAGYRLGDTVTRAELAKVTANLGGYTATECSGTVYGDVNSKLGDLCGYIEALAQAGLVSTSNANFRPSAPVTRAEMTKMLLGAVGETASDVDAGYMDVANLGDLAGYINRANEIGCASNATYFRPNATASRGEAFKIASCAAQLDTDTTEPTVPPSTNTGSTGSTTTTGSTVAGALTAAIDGTAVAQYVPKNASSVKVGSVKLTAATNDVTVSTVTVNRSGLGDSTDLTIAVAQSGSSISESRSVNTATQDAVIRLNAPLTIKAGTTVSLDVLASFGAASRENNQHQFTVKAIGTTASVTGLPVTLGLVNTTSYSVSVVAAQAVKLNSVTSGKNDQALGTVELRAGSKDVTLNGFTLSKTSGVDMTKALANIKVYKNASVVGTATLTSDKIYVTGLNTKVARNDTVTFELRGDVTYVGANTLNVDDIGLSISESTDVSGIEDLTGYAVGVSGTPLAAAANPKIGLSTLDLTWTKNTTKSQTVARGTSNVVLFDAKLASSASFDVTEFTVSAVGAATPTTDLTETGSYNSLTLTVNGVDYDLLTTSMSAGVYTFNKTADKFRIDAGSPVNVRLTANLSNTAGTGVYSYQAAITKVKNVSTGNEVTLAGKNITGDTVTVAVPTLKVKASTVAAPSSSKIYSNASGLEVGRFGLEATAEEITVREITLTNVASANALNDFTKLVSGTNVKLVNVADDKAVSATVTMSGTTAIKLTGMSIKVAKDTTSNFKIVVDTQGDLATTFNSLNKLKFNVAVPSASSSSTSSITVTSLNTDKEYTVSVIPPTVTLTKKNANTFLVKITNADADQDITLNSITAQVRPVSVSNSNYSATTCIREEGSSDKCNVATSGTGSVPGAAKEFVFATAISISKNSNVTREIYVDSNFVSPTDLQGEVTGLKYNTSVTETYSVIAQ